MMHFAFLMYSSEVDLPHQSTSLPRSVKRKISGEMTPSRFYFTFKVLHSALVVKTMRQLMTNHAANGGKVHTLWPFAIEKGTLQDASWQTTGLVTNSIFFCFLFVKTH